MQSINEGHELKIIRAYIVDKDGATKYPDYSFVQENITQYQELYNRWLYVTQYHKIILYTWIPIMMLFRKSNFPSREDFYKCQHYQQEFVFYDYFKELFFELNDSLCEEFSHVGTDMFYEEVTKLIDNIKNKMYPIIISNEINIQKYPLLYSLAYEKMTIDSVVKLIIITKSHKLSKTKFPIDLSEASFAKIKIIIRNVIEYLIQSERCYHGNITMNNMYSADGNILFPNLNNIVNRMYGIDLDMIIFLNSAKDIVLAKSIKPKIGAIFSKVVDKFATINFRRRYSKQRKYDIIMSIDSYTKLGEKLRCDLKRYTYSGKGSYFATALLALKGLGCKIVYGHNLRKDFIESLTLQENIDYLSKRKIMTPEYLIRIMHI
jgi:hypothetical protein